MASILERIQHDETYAQEENQHRTSVLFEIFVFLFTLFYLFTLIVGGFSRAGYVSLCYLLLFMFSTAFPSHYEYYHSTIAAKKSSGLGIAGRRHSIIVAKNFSEERLSYMHWVSHYVRVAPRFPVMIVSLLLSLSMAITQTVMQLIFAFSNDISRYEQPYIKDLLHDIGIVSFRGKPFVTIVTTVLPEALILPSSLMTILLMSILWGKKRKYFLFRRNYGKDKKDDDSNKNKDQLVNKRKEDGRANLDRDKNGTINASETESKAKKSPLVLSRNLSRSGSSMIRRTTQRERRESIAISEASNSILDPSSIEKRPPFISDFKQTVVNMFIMAAAAFRPSLLSSPYFFLFFATMALFSLKTKMGGPFLFSIWICVAFYSGLLLLLMSVTRLHFIVQITSIVWVEMIGFMDLTTLKWDLWPMYGFIMSILALYIVTCNFCNQYILDVAAFKANPEESIHAISHFVLKKKKSKTIYSIRKYAERLFGKFKDMVFSYTPMILLLAFLVMSVTFPSLLAMVYLFLLYFGILVPSRIFTRILPVVLLYCFLKSTGQYLFNLPGFIGFIPPTYIPVLKKIGFRKEENYSLFFFGNLLLCFLISATFRVHLTHIHNHETTSLSEKDPLITNQDATKNYNTTAPDATNASNTVEQKRDFFFFSMKVIKSISNGLLLLGRIIINLLIGYSYYVALVVVYITDLASDHADIFHAIYRKHLLRDSFDNVPSSQLNILVLFFFIFWVSRSTAQRAWILLVLYAQIVIACLYFFNVYFPEMTGPYFKLVGLIQFSKGSFWEGLITHLLLLIFVSIEYHVLNVKSLGGIIIDSSAYNKDISQLPAFLRNIGNFMYDLFNELGATVFLIIIAIIICISPTVNLFHFTLLIIFCLCTSVYTIIPKAHAWKFLFVLFHIVVIVCGFIFFASYCFQFPVISEWFVELLRDISSRYRLFITPANIGLQKYENKPIGLLPNTVMMLLSLLVLKNLQYLFFMRSLQSTKKDKQEEDNESTRKYFDIFVTYVKTFSILHTPKFILIFLFIAAQTNTSVIGLFYFAAAIIFAPIPSLAGKIWFFVLIYSQVISIVQYLYQNPIIVANFDCETPFQPSMVDSWCSWFHWIGLVNIRSQVEFDENQDPTTPYPWVGQVLWQHILILCATAYQRRCLEWRSELIKKDLFQDGILIPEHEKQNVVDGETNKIFYTLRKALKNIINHFFETYGFEISLFSILVGSLLLLDTVWGLIYLMLFGICLFVGKKRISKGWVLIVIAMEINMIVLYIIGMKPFPYFDLEKVLFSWEYAWIFNYLRIKVDLNISIYLYLILFLMAQESRVIFEKRHNFNENEVLPTELLRTEQQRQKKMHVFLPPPPGLTDFTLQRNPRNFFNEMRLFFVYEAFPKFILIFVFVATTIDPTLIKLLQLCLCLFFLNFSDHLIWKGKRLWKWLAVSFYAGLLLQAFFQIPITLYGDPVTWEKPRWLEIIRRLFGFRLIHFASLWWDIAVLLFFYIQERILDRKDYIFYTNYLFRNKTLRMRQLKRNNAFRASKLLKQFSARAKMELKQKQSMEALRSYQSEQFSDDYADRKELARKYREIQESAKQENLDDTDVSFALESAVDKVLSCPGLEKINKKLLIRIITETNSQREALRLISSVDDDDLDGGEEQPHMTRTISTSSETLKKVLITSLQEEMKEEEEEDQKITEKSKHKSKGHSVSFSSPLEETNTLVGMEAEKDEDIKDISTEEVMTPAKVRRTVTGALFAFDEEKTSTMISEKNPQQTWKDRILTLLLAIIYHLSTGIDFVTHFMEEYISVAYDVDENINEAENADEDNQTNLQKKFIDLKNSIIRFSTVIKYLHLSNTDFFCYSVFVLNFIVSPTVYNTLFTLSAFGFAAMQYPVPHKFYWYFIFLIAQFFIFLEYIFFLMQRSDPSIGTNLSNEVANALSVIGWKQADRLVFDIVFYLFIMLVVSYHRNILKTRGDWDYYSQSSLQNAATDKNSPANTPSEKESNILADDDNVDSVDDEKEDQKSDDSFIEGESEVEIVEIDIEEAPSRIKAFFSGISAFFNKHFRIVLLDSMYKVGADYYVPMVLIEIISFALFFFGYQVLSGRPSDDITGAIRYNELDGGFVVLLIFFFLVLVLDRIIYLYTSITAKLVIQFILILTYHVMFLVNYHSLISFSNTMGRVVLGFLFSLKCIYLWISALQISRGYTKDTYIFFFANKFHWISYLFYVIWRAIPFIFELKTLLDWTFTTTTLRFYDWIKLEDINAALYRRKCDLVYRNSLGRKVGDKQPISTKAGAGFLIFLIITGIIFFPLFFYSSANPVFEFNTISKVSLSVGFNGHENLYRTQFYDPDPTIIPYGRYLASISAEVLAEDFSAFASRENFQNFTLNEYSEAYWLISPPSKSSLVEVINKTNLPLVLEYQLERKGPETQKEISEQQPLTLSPEKRYELQQMIEGKLDSATISFNYNPYLLNRAAALTTAVIKDKYLPQCDLKIRSSGTPTTFSWWSINCTQLVFSDGSTTISGPYFHIQSSRISGGNNPILSALSSFGIIAFYTTFVLAVGRFFRTYVSDVIGRIFYEDLDDVDLLIAYVQDIYLARANMDLRLEETMYHHLIMVFRDPHILSAWTKPKLE